MSDEPNEPTTPTNHTTATLDDSMSNFVSAMNQILSIPPVSSMEAINNEASSTPPSIPNLTTLSTEALNSPSTSALTSVPIPAWTASLAEALISPSTPVASSVNTDEINLTDMPSPLPMPDEELPPPPPPPPSLVLPQVVIPNFQSTIQTLINESQHPHIEQLIQNMVMNPITAHGTGGTPLMNALAQSFQEKPAYKKVLSEKGKSQLKTIKYSAETCQQDKCPIIQENFSEGEEVIQLPCEHYFNTDAIHEWLENQKSECPVCRFELDFIEILIEKPAETSDEDAEEMQTVGQAIAYLTAKEE